MSWKTTVLCCVLVCCTGTAALADCDAILQRISSLGKQANALADESNAIYNSMRSCDQEYTALTGQVDQSPPDQRQGSLQRLDDQLSRCQSLMTSRIATLQTLIAVRSEQCAVWREFDAGACSDSSELGNCYSALDGHRKNLELMRSYETWILGAKSRIAQDRQALSASAAQAAAKQATANQAAAGQGAAGQGAAGQGAAGQGAAGQAAANQAAAGQPKADDPPVVVVVNEAGMTVFVHAGGYGGANSIPPGGSVRYDLSKTTATDMDTGQTFSTKTLVVVGGGVWTGSPYTSYEGMTLCSRRTFGHESGEVVWQIRPGLEANCGVRGYHQPQ